MISPFLVEYLLCVFWGVARGRIVCMDLAIGVESYNMNFSDGNLCWWWQLAAWLAGMDLWWWKGSFR